jgi:two-component system, response regulator PdtaR
MTSRRIVIADDESIIRLDLKELLEEAGFFVVGEAADGRAAVEVIRETKPDLAVLDVKMPELDGIEVARIVGETTPVVLLTAFSQRTLIDEAVDAGVLAYLVKPFKGAEVVEKLNWILSEEIGAVTPSANIDDKIETRAIVERAKVVLMESLGIDEPTAFDRIQKTAMRDRLRMREVALHIVQEGVYG